MNRVIKRIERFSFYNNQAIVSHLETMALMGYKLIDIDKSVWTYKIIKPSPIKYRLTYFENQSVIFHSNPYIKRTEEEFYEYCRNVGWVLAGQWGKMQIFYTATDEYREIETNYEKELIALKTATQRKALPSTLAMSGLAIAQGVFQMVQFVNYPVKNISSPTFVVLCFIWGILFLAGLFGAFGYFSWKSKAEVSIKKYGKYPMGQDAKDSKYRISIGLILVAILLFIGQSLMVVLKFSPAFAVFYISQIIISLLFVNRMHNRSNLDAEPEPHVNTRTSVAVKKLLLSTFILTTMLNGIINLDWLSLDPEVPIHTIEIANGTLTIELFSDDIPLKVEDLVSIEYPYYAYQMSTKESIFAKYVKCSQYSFNIDAPEFSYDMVTFKNNSFYENCLDYYLSPFLSDENLLNVHQTNDPVWNAQRVYQVFDANTPLGTYILCYDDMIIYYDGFDVLTSQQAEIVYEKLRL